MTSSIFTVLTLVFCWAANESTPDTESLVKDFNKVKLRLSKEELKKRQVLGSLYKINLSMKKIAQKKGNLTKNLLSTEGRVRRLARKIASLENTTNDQRKLLRMRLRSIYKTGSHSLLRMLFAQSSPNELDRMLKYLRIVSDKDYQMIRQYRSNISELEAKQIRIQKQTRKFLELRGNIKKQEDLLAEQYKQKSMIVRSLDRRRRLQLTKMAELRKRGHELTGHKKDMADMLGSLLSPSFYEHMGRLQHPVHGKIIRRFGVISDNSHHLQFNHKGYFYSAKSGRTIQAIFSGEVVFAGPLRGYGKTLIVNHGDHYYSVYAHNGELKVKKGDRVVQHQAIGVVGKKALTGQTGLYFEIRHFSSPENPKKWLK